MGTTLRLPRNNKSYNDFRTAKPRKTAEFIENAGDAYGVSPFSSSQGMLMHKTNQRNHKINYNK